MKSFIDELKGMSPKQLMLLAAQMKRELTVVQKRQHEAIAIVGMGCRFPGASQLRKSTGRDFVKDMMVSQMFLRIAGIMRNTTIRISGLLGRSGQKGRFPF